MEIIVYDYNTLSESNILQQIVGQYKFFTDLSMFSDTYRIHPHFNNTIFKSKKNTYELLFYVNGIFKMKCKR